MTASRREFIKAVTIGAAAAAVEAQMEPHAAATPTAINNRNAVNKPDNSTLWYNSPAANWLEALPVGNGRIAAMVFGGAAKEQLQLNEGTLWAGGPHDYTSPEGLANLAEIRKLVFEEKWQEAQNLADAKLLGRPASQMQYQTVGSLIIEAGASEAPSAYHRQLDLKDAIASASYSAGGVHFQRETFASAPHQVIVQRWSADKPGSLSLKLHFESPLHTSPPRIDGADTLVIDGENGASNGVAGKLKFRAAVRVYTQGGKVISSEKSDLLEVSGATQVTLHIAIATSYNSYSDVSGDPVERVSSALKQAAAVPYEALRREHLADYHHLYRRSSLDLGPALGVVLPTNERVRAFHEGKDPQLAALHYQYGRYLLISCSRPGGQPATLQGLWNDSVSPPWGSKYTININTEMNYWPAGPANIAECYDPLFKMLKELSVAGTRTAKGLYGARGWVCHHNTDGWRGSSPVDAAYYGMWPLGGAWLCKNLWDHYEFTQDTKALREHYPILRDAALLFLDALVPDPKHGWLVTCPSVSPEHGHHNGVSICAGPTMDNQILHDLFSACIQASELLNEDADLRAKWKETAAKLPPMQIGSEGQLQEWLEDWDMHAEDIHHRHVSHLYGLYPSDQITKRHTPELFAAARKSLEIRGDMATGWSLAWKINLWARLEEGDRAYKLLGDLLTPERTAPNLFDLHPPFQIDGNFGAAAGILEMLVQSRNGEIHILPALPKAWPDGEAKGICARGGFVLDIHWKNGSLAQLRIVSLAGKTCKLRLGEKTTEVPTTKGSTTTLNSDLKTA